MNNEKWLYFRQVADEASDGLASGNTTGRTPGSLLVPASRLMSMHPTSDTLLSLYFNPVRGATPGLSGQSMRDRVDLTVTEGDIFEVMEAISSAINAGPHSDGFIVVADDVTTTDSAITALADLTVSGQYIHKSISGCAAIVVNQDNEGYGVHEYYEVVSPTAADDNDVAVSLSIVLPAQAVIVEAGLIPVELAGTNHGLLALEIHSAHIADDAASGGTEIVGADTLALTQREDNDDYAGTTNTANNTSIPDADADLDAAGGVVGKGVWMGVADPIARGTALTYLHVCAKEDLSSMTGTPKVGVYVKWLGAAPLRNTNVA